MRFQSAGITEEHSDDDAVQKQVEREADKFQQRQDMQVVFSKPAAAD